MHARYTSYSPDFESPPFTPPYKDKNDYRPRRTLPIYRYRRLLLAVPLILCILYISGFHLPRRKPIHKPSIDHKNVIWSRYAYTLYATNQAYLCNAVMLFESLHRLGSKADRVLFVPEEWDTEIGNRDDRNSQLLVKARDWYGVDLVPVNKQEYAALVGQDIQAGEDERKAAEAQKEEARRRTEKGAEGEDTQGKKEKAGKEKPKKRSGWEGGFMKFLAWGQTSYDRVLHLDADITLRAHMDELFLLPSAPVAMMRAYWLLPAERRLTSLFILLEPSEKEFQRLMAAAKTTTKNADNRDWDMEILNQIYGDEALVLPHKGYALLSGEFRTHDHSNFLGTVGEKRDWDADRALSETKLVHFSDWPLPKPWIMWPHLLLPEIMPKCRYLDSGIMDNCKDKQVWMGLYDDFRKRRKDVCALLSAPAPDWPPANQTAVDVGKSAAQAGKEKESEAIESKGDDEKALRDTADGEKEKTAAPKSEGS